MAQVQFSVYRYNPDVDNAPRMQEYTLQTVSSTLNTKKLNRI